MKQQPIDFYQQQIISLTQRLRQLQSKKSVTSWLRLLMVMIEISSLYYGWQWGWFPLLLISIVLIGLFLWLVARSIQLADESAITQNLLQINQDEISCLQHQFTHRHDGSEFMREFQLQDNDLDLFGKASLFQYINRGNSEQGRLALAEKLILTPHETQVLQRQEAVKELSAMPLWRQQLQAYTHQQGFTRKAEEDLMRWIEDNATNWRSRQYWIFQLGIPAISFSSVILYGFNLISIGAMNTMLILVLGFVFSFQKKIMKEYNRLAQNSDMLKALTPSFSWIEQQPFQSTLMQQHRQQLLAGNIASKEIKRLQKILHRIEYRLNPIVHIPLNVFLFWDLQQMMALQQWKNNQSTHLRQWFKSHGETEALCSLANLSFNQPAWAFPQISSHWFQLECKAAGHPLISESKRVTNDFSLQGQPAIAIITGSNMAGKSTFLRTLGVNMVLAMAGAPVCASYMRTSVARLLSSMRIADNLEEATSTFYAELKKMRNIVTAVNAHEKVFILIDEMLRGTNTFDRHTGSMALLKQLIHQNAAAIIATHDVALGEMEKTHPETIGNYHFDSTVINEEIVFDYLLKPGVCQSANASLLMKKMGIEIE